MWKFLRKMMLFAAVFYAVSSSYALVVEDQISPRNCGKHLWALRQVGHKYDYAFVGSSRTEMVVDPLIIDSALGTETVNIGASGAGAGDQYLLAYHLSSSNTVKTFVCQIDYITVADHFTYAFRDYFWLYCQQDSVTRQVIVDHCGALKYAAWQLMPALRMMEFSAQYDLHESSVHWGDSFIKTKGGQQRDEPYDPNRKSSYATYSPNSLAMTYLQMLITHCQTNNIELIFFQAPFPDSVHEVSEFLKCTEAIDQLVANNNIEYWDYSDIYKDRKELFYDNHHMNSAGVKVFSEELARRMAGHHLSRSGQ